MGYGLRVVRRQKTRGTGSPESLKRPGRFESTESGRGRPVKGPLLGKLPESAREGLEAIGSSATYPKATILFVEGQAPTGVFLIVKGRVKLFTNCADGSSLILRIAEPGEPLGLSAAISGKPQEVTAEALELIQANFVPRDMFLEFLRRNSEAALRMAEIVSDIYQATYQEVRNVGLSGSAAERLARLLLGLTDEHKPGRGPIRTTLRLTHEEIAEMIGTSRETVTRLFSKFKRQGLVELSDATVTIIDKAGLEKLLKA